MSTKNSSGINRTKPSVFNIVLSVFYIYANTPVDWKIEHVVEWAQHLLLLKESSIDGLRKNDVSGKALFHIPSPELLVKCYGVDKNDAIILVKEINKLKGDSKYCKLTESSVKRWSTEDVVDWCRTLDDFTEWDLKFLRDEEFDGSSILLTEPEYFLKKGLSVGATSSLFIALSRNRVRYSANKEDQYKRYLQPEEFDLNELAEEIKRGPGIPKLPMLGSRSMEGLVFSENLKFVDQDRIPDLRFLSGLYGYKEGMKTVLIENIHSVALIGPEGCGKTYTLFQLAQMRFGLYFDQMAHLDFIHFIKIVSISANGIYYPNETEVDPHVHRIVAARLIALFILQDHYGAELTPERWLLFQISGYLTDQALFDSFFKPIYERMDKFKDLTWHLFDKYSKRFPDTLSKDLRYPYSELEGLLILVDNADQCLRYNNSGLVYIKSVHHSLMRSLYRIGIRNPHSESLDKKVELIIAGRSDDLHRFRRGDITKFAYVSKLVKKQLETQEQSDEYLEQFFKKELLKKNLCQLIFETFKGSFKWYHQFFEVCFRLELRTLKLATVKLIIDRFLRKEIEAHVEEVPVDIGLQKRGFYDL